MHCRPSFQQLTSSQRGGNGNCQGRLSDRLPQDGGQDLDSKYPVLGLVSHPGLLFCLTLIKLTTFPPSLQLNIGIIAACATSLKPLFSRILRLNSTERYYNTPGARYGYGSRSRGNKLPGDGKNETGTGTGTHPGGKGGSKMFRGAGPVHEYELETAIRTSGDENLSNTKAETYSTATSFYKSDGLSSSEERILGGPGSRPAVQMPPHALTTDGIVRTTEVRVTVK